MNSLLQTILSNGMVQARIKKYVNNLSIAAGAATLTLVTTFLTTHFHSLSTESISLIAGFVATTAAGAVLMIGGVVESQMDVSTVNAKVITAAATGNPADANNKAVIAQVKAAAGTPEALDALVAKLKAGNV